MQDQTYPNTVPADHPADILISRNADGTSTFEFVPIKLSLTQPTALGAAMAAVAQMSKSDDQTTMLERQPAKAHFEDNKRHDAMEAVLRSLPVATGDTLDEILQSSEPVVIDFWSSGCLPGKQMAQTVHEAAQRLEGQVRFYGFELEMGQGTSLFEKLDVPGLSTYLVYQKGQELACLSGLQGTNTLVAAVEAATRIAAPA